MAEKKLLLIAKANASGLRRVLYREQLTDGHDQVKSDKLYSNDPDSLAEYVWDTISDRSYLPGTNIDDGWMDSLYESIAALVNNFQPGTRNQIRVNIEEHTDPDDDQVYGRLYAKIWGNGIAFTEVYQNLMRPAPPPPDAAFPVDWVDNLFGEYAAHVGGLFTIPSFDYSSLIGQDLILNVRLIDESNDEEIVPWTNAASLNYTIHYTLQTRVIRLELWLNSNANGITNAYTSKTWLVQPPVVVPPSFPEGWVPEYMFQKQLRVNEPFEFRPFDPETVNGSGNLVLRVMFMHGEEELTEWELVEDSNYTPPPELQNEGITIVFALTDGEGTANDTFLLAVLPPIV